MLNTQKTGVIGKMKMRKTFVFSMLFFTGIVMFLFLIMQPLTIYYFRDSIAVLFPKGIIALEQRNLLYILQAIMLLVIIPVYILTFIFCWKYSANNPKGKYDPDLIDNTLAEYVWWGIPCVITLIIGVLTWNKTYELDPFKPITSEKKEMTIQVVALDWKWLFIYPEEKIATVNFVQFPKQVPVRFEITADAPMNSFWIPHLGGQIYAMPNMKTILHLIADENGEYRGSSANLSGVGFAGMHFVTKVTSEEDYHQWVESAKQSSVGIGVEEYKKLAAPSQNNPVEIFHLKDSNLFDHVLMKFMHPLSETSIKTNE